jgi:hypothetical protein
MIEREYLKFRRPADACLLCAASLPSTGAHPSLIQLSDKDEAIRRDFCPTCWQKSSDREYFSFWLTKRISAPTARERRLARAERNDALWRLFNALYDQAAPDTGPQLFLLAHLLMRYRVVSYTGRGIDGSLLFEHGASGSTFRIPDMAEDAAPFADIKKSIEEQAVAMVERPDDDPEGRATA